MPDKACLSPSYLELTEREVRQLVRESKELREKSAAILLVLARADAKSNDLSTRIEATRERIRASWERMIHFAR